MVRFGLAEAKRDQRNQLILPAPANFMLHRLYWTIPFGSMTNFFAAPLSKS